MIVRRVVRLLGTVALLGGASGVGLATAPAWGAAVTGHGVPVVFDFGSSGISGAIPLSAGPPTTLSDFDPSAAGCPFDSTVAFAITANGVDHMTGNKNGFWAGGTATGPTTLEALGGTPLYMGQATAWGGIGTNIGPTESVGQFEEGETFHFHGTAVDPNNPWQKLDVSLGYHFAVNNNGAITKATENLNCR